MAERTRSGARARTSPPAGSAPPVRKRPKNRKAQIATVAAEAFSERGYHGVSIEDIAKAVGISGPALYRHFPNKYALFVQAVNQLADALDAALSQFDDDTPDDGAAAILDKRLTATIGMTIDNRRTGGLYRWERRYLSDDDQAKVRGKMAVINRRLAQTLRELRPGLTATDAALLATAQLSVIGSITTHRVPLATRRLQSLLLDACRSVAATSLVPDEPAAAPTERTGIAVANKREVLLHEAVLLFDARGYHEVSIEEIGAAAEINASGVYRHFASKADLLAAAFHRAGDRVALAVSSALADSSTPAQALEHLTEVYVELSFAQNALMSVYFAEIGNLPAAHRSDLRNIQRLNIEEWARLVADLRTDLTPVECRILVHAALNLVLDVGEMTRFRNSASNRRRTVDLMLAVLLGDAATRRDSEASAASTGTRT